MQLIDQQQIRIKVVPAPGYAHEIRQIFTTTFALGVLDTSELGMFNAYAELSLSWYLNHLEYAVVALDKNQVVGYAFFCPDVDDYNTWIRRESLRFLFKFSKHLATGRITQKDIGFIRRRFFDSLSIMVNRRSATVARLPHAHLNVLSGYRSGEVALALLQSVDDLCRSSGCEEWVGEVNAFEQSRRKSLERIVGEIQSVTPNRTFSWLCKRSVYRITVRRQVS